MQCLAIGKTWKTSIPRTKTSRLNAPGRKVLPRASRQSQCQFTLRQSQYSKKSTSPTTTQYQTRGKSISAKTAIPSTLGSLLVTVVESKGAYFCKKANVVSSRTKIHSLLSSEMTILGTRASPRSFLPHNELSSANRKEKRTVTKG